MAAIDYIASVLVQAIAAAGVPVISVSIPDPTDRTTWRAQLDKAATPADAQTAQNAIDSFDLSTLPAKQADTAAMSDVDQKVLRAIAQALWEAIPAPTMTKVQLRARAIAIWKTL